MTAPDPKTVREIARKFLLDPHMTASDLKALIRDAMAADAPDETFGAWYDAVRADARQGRVETVASWPDEQQPDEATGGEQAQDGAARRLESWLAVPNHFGAQIEADLRTVLAERDALAARVAELTAERDDDLCILAAFLLPNRRPIEEWLCILANHFEARTNALMRDADRFAAARFRVDRVPNAAETEES